MPNLSDRPACVTLATEDLRRHEHIRGMQLARAAYALESVAVRLTALRWEDPALGCAELASMVQSASSAVITMAEVAGFFDAMAAVAGCARPGRVDAP